MLFLTLIVCELKTVCVYIRMSPRYSVAPSPLPAKALADAHLTELLAPMPLMIAPACSAGSNCPGAVPWWCLATPRPPFIDAY